ncbi:MAG TPA: hypothetical protein VL988_07175 [Solirubrobacteraceae bacterium]|nr:hypothetical protein [Solirubrobacteraceae bacterium]
MSSHSNTPRCGRPLVWAVAAFVLMFALYGATLARAQTSSTGTGAGTPQTGATTTPAAGAVTATLEECATTGAQAERAATFAGEMSVVPGAARMAIRIDVEERAAGEAEFQRQAVGQWRLSDPKVKVYKYLKQFTNLSPAASYRGVVHFRWLNAKGHVMKRAERLTGRCLQPAPAEETTEPGSTTTTPAPGTTTKTS